ncbi:hypothetical protein CTAM01_03799 [Colletotrichum tamarilloi]|uniref:Uncharacterized protein n=1 Tax=Colletotrichum tamarilloi TaxID=1209934 RepID=A0ABQ9RII7_9PEZI|nr:uncharacterized protein CTAM01_03799 [Colletotrichum tamarilloi]KAK1504492.1 hypothetical protein CTAM01_03799 [Colletotrichum tamarilloi]
MSATIFGLSCGIELYIASVDWGWLSPPHNLSLHWTPPTVLTIHNGSLFMSRIKLTQLCHTSRTHFI